jgi:hypothetical protein
LLPPSAAHGASAVRARTAAHATRPRDTLELLFGNHLEMGTSGCSRDDVGVCVNDNTGNTGPDSKGAERLPDQHRQFGDNSDSARAQTVVRIVPLALRSAFGSFSDGLDHELPTVELE